MGPLRSVAASGSKNSKFRDSERTPDDGRLQTLDIKILAALCGTHRKRLTLMKFGKSGSGISEDIL
jgi:hypothetical protein